MNNLISYSHRNNLVPNPTKTVYTIFYPHEQQPEFKLTIDDTVLDSKDSAPLLGITIEKQLTHKKTVTKIVSKLQPIMQQLRYANKFLTTEMLKHVYYTHCQSHMLYAITVWGTDRNNAVYIQPLIRAQKKCIRLICNKPPLTPTAPLFQQLQLLTLTNLYTQRVCLEMHPHMYGTTPKHLPHHNHDYTRTAQTHQHGTRLSKFTTIFLENARNTGQNHTGGMAHLNREYVQIWNKLPNTLRSIPTYTTFKKELKLHLLKLQHSDEEPDPKGQTLKKDQPPSSTHKPRTPQRALQFSK